MREESAIGHPHRHYTRTDSTNTRARELAAAGAPHGTVVTAGEQSEGRGRQGRSWTAPAGKALLYSAILRPLDQHDALLPLAVPLAVCEAAEELEPGIECGVKWPNDVLVDGRKLAGVLIEARPQDGWAVIGVGLNLTIATDEFPPELREAATSLSIERGRSLSPTGLQTTTALHAAAAALSRRLDWWLDTDQGTVLETWRERDVLRGREVSWEGGSGVAAGIDDRGYLLVVVPGGERIAVGAGEIHLTRA
ncbi:MAG TPA: biotin--[acetyl-CoA-carboxylase] ligase [Solirubrobacterales bacterium]|nr:biotin--[acetyl-CoA-carboxylase] ligase [Solirubrobacterales bacterium]